MSTETGYKKQILSYGWQELSALWSDIQTGNTPNWEPGKALEYLILRVFQLEGAEVTYPYSVVIEGAELEQIDGVVYTDGLHCLIECKDTAKRVNIEPIAKMRNQLLRRPATTIGLIFSRSRFTESAKTLAQFIPPQTILLWNGSEINTAIQQQQMRQLLVKKYRYCVEYGMPNYSI